MYITSQMFVLSRLLFPESLAPLSASCLPPNSSHSVCLTIIIGSFKTESLHVFSINVENTINKGKPLEEVFVSTVKPVCSIYFNSSCISYTWQRKLYLVDRHKPHRRRLNKMNWEQALIQHVLPFPILTVNVSSSSSYHLNGGTKLALCIL